jgi:hypothetical protein
MSELSLLNALVAEEALDLDGAILDAAGPPAVPVEQPVRELPGIPIHRPAIALPGQYTGWHHMCFPKAKFPCASPECMHVNKHPNNYWMCGPCAMVQWFTSNITTLKGDDLHRACARKRLGAVDPLPVHSEMQKVHKTFRQRGGLIHVLANARDLPTIHHLCSNNCTVTYPAHLPIDCLRGTVRARERANGLAVVVADPYVVTP